MSMAAVQPSAAGDVGRDTPVMLSARGLRKEFGGFVAVNNVELDVHHARVQAKVARMGLVRSFQISAVFPHLSVLDNVRVALQRPGGLATQFWLPMRSLNRLNERAMQLIESVGLADKRHEPAADLSYGRKRVLEIATTLALEPKVLLLDEPMAGMGHEDVHVVAEIIREVATQRAVLMVEHNLKVVADLCHQVTVLQRGEILTSGDYRTVSQDERVRVAYMGTDDD